MGNSNTLTMGDLYSDIGISYNRGVRLWCSNLLVIERSKEYMEWPQRKIIDAYTRAKVNMFKYLPEHNLLDYEVAPPADVAVVCSMEDYLVEDVRTTMTKEKMRLVVPLGAKNVDQLMYYPVMYQFIKREIGDRYEALSFHSMSSPATWVLKRLSEVLNTEIQIVYREQGHGDVAVACMASYRRGRETTPKYQSVDGRGNAGITIMGLKMSYSELMKKELGVGSMGYVHEAGEL